MKIKDYVKKIFDEPNMSDADANSILWGCTGYPSFFDGDPVRCLTKQLRHAKRSLARGYSVDEIFFGKDKVKKSERKEFSAGV